ncbi:MAG: ROK family protein, partial [Myxococcales bacterium]
ACRCSTARARTPSSNDMHARHVLDEFLAHFGRALANVISTVDPDIVVIGGGVSQIAELYTEGRARVAAEVFNDELLTPIVPARLGPAAGVLGAALLVV